MKFLSGSISDNYGMWLNIAASDDKTGRLTCICGKVFEENGYVVANYNIRYPVCCDIDSLFIRLAARAAEYGFSASIESHSAGYFCSENRPEVKALSDAFREITGLESKPYTMGGGTYARIFPNTVAFGAELPGETDLLGPGRGGAHQQDEYWRYDEMITSVKVFVKALENLADLRG
jgi:succinyl-diaminopimelate desuccinylase